MALIKVFCPCCKESSRKLGKLQDGNWFAGVYLEHSLSGGYLYRCSNCKLKFRYPVQTIDYYNKLYDVEVVKEVWGEQFVRNDWKIIVNYVNETIPKGRKILDFGCYTGGLLRQLDEGYQKYGVEISKSAVHLSEKHIDVKVWGDIDDIPTGLVFDVIVMSDVIEHITNPELFLVKMMSLLSSDGVLIITTGDADNFIWNIFGANWWYCYIAEHVAFISESWIRYFSKKYNISILRFEKFNYLRFGCGIYLLNFLLMVFYGVLPRTYLRLGKLFKNMFGRSEDFVARGVGINADHIFLVLSKKNL